MRPQAPGGTSDAERWTRTVALSDTAIRALRPKDKRYLVADDRGLALEVYPSGGLAWRYRYRLNGKLEKVALGKYPAVSLKMARTRRDDMARLVAEGKSPALQKQLAKVAIAESTTLKDFGDRYFREIVERDWKNPNSIRRYLNKDIYPRMGSIRMRDVTRGDVEKVVFAKRDQGFDAAAGQIRNLLKRMFDYAEALNLVNGNPARALAMKYIAKLNPRDRSLSAAELTVFLHAVYASNMRRQFKLALHLILLTMVRKSELMLAKWSEFNLEEGVWEIPPDRMKMAKGHIVYLSTQAVEILKELQALASTSEYVFPGRSSLSKPFAHNAINVALRAINIPIPAFTVHDLRRTASTLLNETQRFGPDVIEHALAHYVGGVRGIYNRAEYAEQRREMLQWWANYVESRITDKTVVIGRFPKVA